MNNKITKNELTKYVFDLMHEYRNSQRVDEALLLLYVLKGWQVLSKTESFDNKLKFGRIINGQYSVDKIGEVFNELNFLRLFDLYSYDENLFSKDELTNMINFVYNNELPYVNEVLEAGHFSKFPITIPPKEVSEIAARLLPTNGKEVYLPFTNTFMPAYYLNNNVKADSVEDMSLFIELMNIIDGISIDYKNLNSFDDPLIENNKLKQSDYVIAFPPFGQKRKIVDAHSRFRFHKGTNLDVAYFEHVLDSTIHKAIILMPVGFTYRSGAEDKVREYLIENNLLEAIIQLPQSLHAATALEMTFFVINRYKEDDSIKFVNLKNTGFTKRVGRQWHLVNIDKIVDICKTKDDEEGISITVSNNAVKDNKYSLAIDRYIMSEDAIKAKKTLESYETIKLKDFVEFGRISTLKDEGYGIKVKEILPSDFEDAGFTTQKGRIKMVGDALDKVDNFKLKSYDVLISTKGTIGKVAIMGEINEDIISSQSNQVLRTNSKEKAIFLYMYLKSEIAQALITSLTSGAAMPLVSTSDLKEIELPILNDEEINKINEKFIEEKELYNKISNLRCNIESLKKNLLTDIKGLK